VERVAEIVEAQQVVALDRLVVGGSSNSSGTSPS